MPKIGGTGGYFICQRCDFWPDSDSSGCDKENKKRSSKSDYY